MIQYPVINIKYALLRILLLGGCIVILFGELLGRSVVAEEIVRYRARLSVSDHFNSKRVRLTRVDQILRQDRANYHKGEHCDSEDEGERFFAHIRNRGVLEDLARKARFASGLCASILKRCPLVEVVIIREGPTWLPRMEVYEVFPKSSGPTYLVPSEPKFSENSGSSLFKSAENIVSIPIIAPAEMESCQNCGAGVHLLGASGQSVNPAIRIERGSEGSEIRRGGRRGWIQFPEGWENGGHVSLVRVSREMAGTLSIWTRVKY